MDAQNEFISDKAAIRAAFIRARSLVTEREERARAAASSAAPLLSGNVMVYIAIGTEMPTRGLIEMLLKKPDVTVYAPHTSAGGIITPRKLLRVDITADKLGNLPESAYGAAGDIDMCVTPLVAFNAAGYRIGYGKGCYDRFFSAHGGVKRIGLAFDCQRTDFVPRQHDMPLDRCVTETNVIYFC